MGTFVNRQDSRCVCCAMALARTNTLRARPTEAYRRMNMAAERCLVSVLLRIDSIDVTVRTQSREAC